VRHPLPRKPRARLTRSLALLLAPAAVAVVVAGCGGGGSSSGAAAHGSAGGGSTSAGATVAIRRTSLGKVLVDAQGRTLYLFEKDRSPASTCYGACASIWPPLTTGGKAVAATGVTAAKLGSSKRSDGKAEVTYAGHPLYTYAGDSTPGQVGGEGLDQFGAKWYVLAPNGHKIDND
jgi:predicted lipoprotein with Yx(FWY)xxD motif